jgi:outer membrane protein assembly factor BamB
MNRSSIARVVSALALLLIAQQSPAGDWLQWRGPLGTGHSDEKNVPLTWSPSENVRWKVALDGAGNSTPIVVGNKVLITHAPADSDMRGLRCYGRASGELLWKHEVRYGEPEPTHDTNPYCSASPVSDGERVVAWYGGAGVFCYDLDGKVLWQRDLGKVEHHWGFGSSPLIHENVVVLNYGPGLNAFVVALDKRTGDEIWRKEFPGQRSSRVNEYRGSWSTPLVHREGDRDVLLLSLPRTLRAVEPQTGEEVWSCDGLGDLVYTSPLIAGEIVIAMSGYGGPALAVRGGGSGNVTGTHRLWHHVDPKPPQRVGSGVVVAGHIFIRNEPSFWCQEAASGERLWEKRLETRGTRSWCSMTHVDGKLYVSNEAGTTYVLRPNTEECQVLAENKLDETTRASHAFSDGQIFMRTYEHLYCIEAQ